MRDGREILHGNAYTKRCRERWEMDGRRCVLCPRRLPEFSTRLIDHIKKRGLGGGWRDDRIENLRTLCFVCHDREDNQGGKPSRWATLKPVQNLDK